MMSTFFPVAKIANRTPVISQEFKPVVHLGVDIMFPRRAADPLHRPSDPRGTRGFYVPAGATAIAAEAGTLHYAHRAPNGWRVRIAHADGWHSLYLHLSALFVPAWELDTPGVFPITAGQPLGPVGGDPTDADPRHTYHLHFERRDSKNVAHDPAPWLRLATYLELPVASFV